MTDKKPEFKSVEEVLHYMQINLHVPKNQKNSFGGYSYRSCEDIMAEIRKVLPEGATVVVGDDIRDFSASGRVYIEAIVRLSFAGKEILNTAFAREPLVKKGMDESQITGAASSYARKYALSGLFLIDDVKDADATNKGSDEVIDGPKAKPAKTPEPETPEQSKIAAGEAEYNALNDNDKLQVNAWAEEIKKLFADDAVTTACKTYQAVERADMKAALWYVLTPMVAIRKTLQQESRNTKKEK